MFTLEAIKAAHAKVKSGADFPKYIQDLKSLDVKNYTSYVSDGHIDYESVNGEQIQAPAKYTTLTIAQQTNADQFKLRLNCINRVVPIILPFVIIAPKQVLKNGWLICQP